MVAFHFQFANQTAWKCDSCRKSGLEIQRHCGFIGGPSSRSSPVVWAREGVATSTCPVSYITPESIALLEEFHAWKLFGCGDFNEWPARTMEAISILENALKTECTRAQE